jgi:hypothetical protein
VKTVPEPLRLRILELLLQDTLNRAEGKKPKRERESEPEDDTPETKPSTGRAAASSLDVSQLPIRAKAFRKKHSITAQHLERLFHVEGKEYAPIWTPQATKFAAVQIHISLLLSLQPALASGEFSFDRDEVRTQCKERGNEHSELQRQLPKSETQKSSYPADNA